MSTGGFVSGEPGGATAAAATAALPTSTVELSMRCEGLRDRDVLSKSDPVCVLFQKPRGESDCGVHGIY